ncbi:hypothetical protein [Nocardioides sp. R-C-SC26]|uniref:hypothetical protein n=1 Tax=Nocardioides sp. R-C-SC26 TaxID=2870414 RepID=UPI001E2CDCBF|nr:hypothetical protein [Nocardioides sp. R-C-SC26]
MSAGGVVAIAADKALLLRIAAVRAIAGGAGDPMQWATANRWRLAGTAGWAQAYESALAADIADPGSDARVITDEQIADAVTDLTAALAQEAAGAQEQQAQALATAVEQAASRALNQALAELAAADAMRRDALTTELRGVAADAARSVVDQAVATALAAQAAPAPATPTPEPQEV